MKKIKFTFWLLGFGCGIAFTGIIGTFFVLSAQSGVQRENAVVDQVSENSIEDINKSADNVSQSEGNTDESAELATITPEASTNGLAEKPLVTENAKSEVAYKEIDIPKADSALEICQLLEKNGLVDSADDFLAYVRANKKQRFLNHGHLTLPVDASYEDLLNAITVS